MNRKQIIITAVSIVAATIFTIAIFSGAFLVKSYQENQLPDCPVDVTYRPALIGNGYVLQFRNTSHEPRRFTAALSNSGATKRTTFVTNPGAVTEIGHLEGWAAAKGDNISVSCDGFRTVHKRIN